MHKRGPLRSPTNSATRKRDQDRRKTLDDMLDRGLEETFPGSDPVAITEPSHSADDLRDITGEE